MAFGNRVVAQVAVFSVLASLAGCGGGGGGGGGTPPPPPGNRAPALASASLATTEDAPGTAQLSATDPDGHPVTFALGASPQHGTATVSAAGLVTYTPAPNYSGVDSIGVTASDNAGAQAAGSVSVTVTAVNDAPVLTTSQIAVDEDGVLSGQLAGTDVEGDAFTFASNAAPAHGVLTLSADGAFTYTPAPDYSGADEFPVRIAEAGGAGSDAQVSITVRPVNDAPVAGDDMLRVAANDGAAVTIPVLGNDTDVEGEALTPQVVSQPAGGGTLSVDATTRELRFAPDNGYVGPIEFRYRVTDGDRESNVATVHAHVGTAENVAFLSDYTSPGVLEVHLFDGLEVRRVSDDLPSGFTISNFAVSGDQRLLAYVADDASVERVYVKPLDGSAPATLRFTSAAKSDPAERRVSVSLNHDGSHALVRDGWAGTTKLYFVVNTQTGVSRRVAGSMAGLVDIRFVMFHPYEPQMLLVQGQTSGTGPSDLANRATSAFIGSAGDARTLTQIGRTYPAGQCGSGEGIYVGNDGRYIYHAEYLCAASVINLIAYDRQTQTESYVVRQAVAPDRGMNGVVQPNPGIGRLCFQFYLPTTVAADGPSRFYVMGTDAPASATVVTPAFDRTTQCTMAGDDRTLVFRRFAAGRLFQQAYSVDSQNPAAPALLAPVGETASEQAAWQVAFGAPRIAIAYFDDDGTAGAAPGETGRFYSMSVDGTGAFLFSDTYVQPSVGNIFNGSSADGAFVLYARPRAGIAALELMSTRVRNLSIPLSRDGETLGVRTMRWLRTGARQN